MNGHMYYPYLLTSRRLCGVNERKRSTSACRRIFGRDLGPQMLEFNSGKMIQLVLVKVIISFLFILFYFIVLFQFLLTMLKKI